MHKMMKVITSHHITFYHNITFIIYPRAQSGARLGTYFQRRYISMRDYNEKILLILQSFILLLSCYLIVREILCYLIFC
jgi:hypothetical protein